jgi:hypothetical protein
MRIAAYTSSEQRDIDLSRAVLSCVGDGDLVTDGNVRDGYDLHSIIGTKSRDIVEQLRDRKYHYIYWDKGYFRNKWPHWWRIAYCRQQPGDLVPHMRFDERRARKQGFFNRLKPWRRSGRHILIGGWSEKCSVFCDIEHPDDIIGDWVRVLRGVTDRQIVYRAKPSWRNASPIAGTKFSDTSRRRIAADLVNAHALVTHNSGTCVDALFHGVPAVILGDGLTRSISSNALSDIERPRHATDAEKRHLVAQMAHLHFNLEELRDGSARNMLLEICEIGAQHVGVET